jgi:tetratricopeptide (TPR) repeat protein
VLPARGPTGDDMATASVAPRKRRVKDTADAVPDTPDPIEIAMVAVASGADRHGAARAVLEKHASLIDVQCEREREELAVLRLRRFTRWLILAGVVALFSSVIAAGWAAARSSSLVIEPFEVPPALEQRGLNGRVVSARVLDHLAQLQRQTESMRGEKSYADNWNDDIKLAIPETGISLGDAWRTLKAWLGSETRISGEIVQTPRGLAITTRAGSLSGGSIEGSEQEIGALVGKAASSIYKVTQPYRYAISLPAEQVEERVRILRGLTGDPSEQERKWAYSGLSVTYRASGDLSQAAVMARRALSIDPQLLPALGNLFYAQLYQGDFESAFETSRRFKAAYREAETGEYDARILLGNLIALSAAEAGIRKDSASLRRLAVEVEGFGTTQSWMALATLYRSSADSLQHDHARAVSRLAAQPLPTPALPRELIGRRYDLANLRLAQTNDHRDASEVTSAIQELEAASVVTPGGSSAQVFRIQRAAQIALALARSGQAEEARVRANRLPRTCYDCLRARGWAARASGDAASALAWFQGAVRLSESAPEAYLDLGDLLLGGGKIKEARTHLEAAAAKSPTWADPQQRLAALTVRTGQLAEAERSYAKAGLLAPRWGRLNLEWADVLWRLGRKADARRKLQTAAGQDLSPKDRALLERMRINMGISSTRASTQG